MKGVFRSCRSCKCGSTYNVVTGGSAKLNELAGKHDGRNLQLDVGVPDLVVVDLPQLGQIDPAKF